MKDWFYEKFVRKNPRVQKAYETYVQGHLEEHQRSRLKHCLCCWLFPGNTGEARSKGFIL